MGEVIFQGKNLELINYAKQAEHLTPEEFEQKYGSKGELLCDFALLEILSDPVDQTFVGSLTGGDPDEDTLNVKRAAIKMSEALGSGRNVVQVGKKTYIV